MTDKLFEKQISSEFLYDGKVVHLYRDDVELPDGGSSVREYIRHIGAVCVVPLTDDNEVICVRQYRYPIGRVMLEIPAGKLDYADEDRECAAMRELREETGAVCEKLEFIGKYLPSPAILDECISMYLARGLRFEAADPDEDEFIEIEKIPLDTLVKMILDGEILDGKTQTALLKTAMIVNDEKRKGNGK